MGAAAAHASTRVNERWELQPHTPPPCHWHIKINVKITHFTRSGDEIPWDRTKTHISVDSEYHDWAIQADDICCANFPRGLVHQQGQTSVYDCLSVMFGPVINTHTPEYAVFASYNIVHSSIIVIRLHHKNDQHLTSLKLGLKRNRSKHKSKICKY